MLYKDQIDKNRIPAHIAIIMDGNGRWAKQQDTPVLSDTRLALRPYMSLRKKPHG